MADDPVATAAGQFYEDHERDMADPEYAEAFRDATADPTTTAASRVCRNCGHDSPHTQQYDCERWPEHRFTLKADTSANREGHTYDLGYEDGITGEPISDQDAGARPL